MKKALSVSLFYTRTRKVKSLGLSILQVSETGFKSRASGPRMRGLKHHLHPEFLSSTESEGKCVGCNAQTEKKKILSCGPNFPPEAWERGPTDEDGLEYWHTGSRAALGVEPPITGHRISRATRCPSQKVYF